MKGLYLSRCALLNEDRNVVKVELIGLQISSLEMNRMNEWPLQLITHSVGSLNILALGFETEIAEAYASNRESVLDVMHHTNSTRFGEVMKRCSGLESPTALLLHLSRLRLDGFDLNYLIDGHCGLAFNLPTVNILSFTSCCGLMGAFQVIGVTKISSRVTPGIVGGLENLKVFKLRHERANTIFQSHLEAFLISLRPLLILEVILEGCSKTQDLTRILKTHGNSLLALVWDERTCQRSEPGRSTSLLPLGLGHLEQIVKFCRRLRWLGITFDWYSIGSSEQGRETVRPELPKVTFR